MKCFMHSWEASVVPLTTGNFKEGLKQLLIQTRRGLPWACENRIKRPRQTSLGTQFWTLSPTNDQVKALAAAVCLFKYAQRIEALNLTRGLWSLPAMQTYSPQCPKLIRLPLIPDPELAQFSPENTWRNEAAATTVITMRYNVHSVRDGISWGRNCGGGYNTK